MYTGEESEPSSNVNKVSEIRESQMQQFMNDLPGLFREKLTSKLQGGQTKKRTDDFLQNF